VRGDRRAPGICDIGPDDFKYLYRIAHLGLAVDNYREAFGALSALSISDPP
jgi:hypothetical protein